MSYTASKKMQSVQDPIIPVVAQWIRENPGTISLGQGVVWYKPPDEIQSGVSAYFADSSSHLYQAVHGVPALLDCVWDKLAVDNKVQRDHARQLVVTSGGNLAFSNAVTAIGDVGDEFILNSPFYFNHEMAITMAACKAVKVSTDENYQLDLNAIAAAITDKTKAIVTVSPGNPTGVVLTKSSLIELNQLCREKGIFHIHDEAYEYFHYGDSSQFSPASLADSSEHTISIYSLSKSFGFASWRIGYMLIPAALFESILKIQDTQIICPAVMSQFAAVPAMRLGRDWCLQQQLPIKESREIVTAKLDGISDICGYPKSDGAFYFYLKINTPMNSLDLCHQLISQHKIAVIPGLTFGSEDACYLRLAYGALTPETAAQGIDRLVTGLKDIVG